MRADWSWERCDGCRCDLHKAGEFAYMLMDDVWRLAIRRARRHGMSASVHDVYCINCFEGRLGRTLTRSDFDWSVPLTAAPDFKRSARLRNRMNT